MNEDRTPRSTRVSLRYQVDGGEEHEIALDGLEIDDLVHVAASLRARQRDNGQARFSTEKALAQVRQVHRQLTENQVEEAVVQGLSEGLGRCARFVPGSVVDRIVVLVMSRVGHIRGEWMTELHDCHSRLLYLQQRVDLLRRQRPIAALTAADDSSS
jgi:hypothetical protein